MKIQNRVLSVILAAAMIITALPFASSAADAHNTEEIIVFGSYPQSEVKEETLISSLNALDAAWTSYGYYSGTGIYDDGKMAPSDFMKYVDVSYEDGRYRGVTFAHYRPTFTGYSLINDIDTCQDNNGYECGKTYWFKYEPL